MEINSGAKKITIAQVAQAAGVSQATVSRVINQRSIVKGETYNQVINAMKEVGYSFDETARPPSFNEGLIILNFPSLDNPFYSEIVKGAKTSATRHGYHLLLNEEHVNPSTISNLICLIKKTHAVGMITLNHIEPDLLKKLSELICIVQCCEYDETLDLPYVSIDDYSASKNIMEHLISRGRNRIAFINGPLRYKYARHRQQGYLAALKSHHIEEDPSLMVQLPEVNYDLVVSAAMQLLSKDPPPDAFFTSSDVYGSAVLRACHLAGCRVPQDVMVTGFDNISFSAMSVPSLTTINQPKTQLGFMTCEILLEKISSPYIPNKKVLLETELIVRESTSV